MTDDVRVERQIVPGTVFSRKIVPGTVLSRKIAESRL